MEALPAPWLWSIAPVGAARIVIVGAAATTGVIVRGVPAACPNAAIRTARSKQHHAMCLVFIET